jgi:transcriptional regulator with XRE-family HTH domain
MNEFADRLRILRGMKSQTVFSDEIGVSQRTLSRYENGALPDIGVAQTLCRRFNVEPRWLLFGEGSVFNFDTTSPDLPENLVNLTVSVHRSREDVLSRDNDQVFVELQKELAEAKQQAAEAKQQAAEAEKAKNEAIIEAKEAYRRAFEAVTAASAEHRKGVRFAFSKSGEDDLQDAD